MLNFDIKSKKDIYRKMKIKFLIIKIFYLCIKLLKSEGVIKQKLIKTIKTKNKMKTKKVLTYVMIFSLVGVLFTSCKKKTDDTDNDTSAAADNALAEGTFNDVHNIADQAATGSLATYDGTYTSNGDKGMLSTCATITLQNVNSLDDDTLHVNFGATNCLCSDGRYRRGTINVVYSGMYADSGSHHTITFTNYFVNDNQILGSKTVVNNGRNAAGHPTFSITVNGTIIKASGAGTITWVSNRTREWTVGYNTPLDWTDDTYSITGTASGTSAAGNTFTASIGTPLIKKMSCHWIESGTIDLTPSGKPVRHFDFGNTGCDNRATVTINGNTYDIFLR